MGNLQPTSDQQWVQGQKQCLLVSSPILYKQGSPGLVIELVSLSLPPTFIYLVYVTPFLSCRSLILCTSLFPPWQNRWEPANSNQLLLSSAHVISDRKPAAWLAGKDWKISLQLMWRNLKLQHYQQLHRMRHKSAKRLSDALQAIWVFFFRDCWTVFNRPVGWANSHYFRASYGTTESLLDWHLWWKKEKERHFRRWISEPQGV